MVNNVGSTFRRIYKCNTNKTFVLPMKGTSLDLLYGAQQNHFHQTHKFWFYHVKQNNYCLSTFKYINTFLIRPKTLDYF